MGFEAKIFRVFFLDDSLLLRRLAGEHELLPLLLLASIGSASWLLLMVDVVLLVAGLLPVLP